MEAVSTIIFLLLLILLAKGFTVTRARLKMSTSVKIGVFMTLFTITYGILFFHEQTYFDPGEVLYLYESPFGYGLIALRLIGWGWFVYAIVRTTQIAVMEKSGQTGDGTLEHFNNYKYAPTRPPTRPQTQQSHTIFAISTTANGSTAHNHTDSHSVYNANSYAMNKSANNGLPVADC
ncbi:unnamed protein product [Oppiella nova]|uniref:GPR180/TMEM145 transmembrane domain-containing protein n=1 Tax=Oppiella nova TaxID=334625 RepID=A0A7R9QHC8_9ACAR|nr:unnamed protein product [Oppiella nova]CAG2165844.1 unnamed protein product [Oppiella nova]